MTALKEKFKGHYEKFKTKLPSNSISTGSSPGKIYGTAKIHKVGTNGKVDNLPIRPMISNIRTATYHLAKYLAHLLKPLSGSRYTVKNTKEFTKKIRKQKIPKDYTMVSFDAVSLFTNVPLEDTMNIIEEFMKRKKL